MGEEPGAGEVVDGEGGGHDDELERPLPGARLLGPQADDAGEEAEENVAGKKEERTGGEGGGEVESSYLYMERSCASSMRMAEYRARRMSRWISFISTPSVISCNQHHLHVVSWLFEAICMVFL